MTASPSYNVDLDDEEPGPLAHPRDTYELPGAPRVPSWRVTLLVWFTRAVLALATGWPWFAQIRRFVLPFAAGDGVFFGDDSLEAAEFVTRENSGLTALLAHTLVFIVLAYLVEHVVVATFLAAARPLRAETARSASWTRALGRGARAFWPMLGYSAVFAFPKGVVLGLGGALGVALAGSFENKWSDPAAAALAVTVFVLTGLLTLVVSVYEATTRAAYVCERVSFIEAMRRGWDAFARQKAALYGALLGRWLLHGALIAAGFVVLRTLNQGPLLVAAAALVHQALDLGRARIDAHWWGRVGRAFAR